MPSDRRMILDLASAQEYEKVLGVAFEAPLEEVHRAHIRLLYRFRGDGEVVEAINRAKSALVGENDLERGRRLFRIGQAARALPCLRRAVERRGCAVDYRRLGSSLVELGRSEEALPYLRRALEMQAAAPGAATPGVGLTLSLAEEDGSAQAALRHGDAMIHRTLGSALVHLGRPEEALAHFQCAARLRGDALDRELLRTCRALVKRKNLRKALAGLSLRPALRSGRLRGSAAMAAVLAPCFYAAGKDPSLASLVCVGALFGLLALWTALRHPV
jgi:tetratricopeptide (TPR) repeat protein